MIYDKPFNLEEIYGPLLDLIVTRISEMPPDLVEHSGVKGMKWGVRKDEKTSSSSRELKMLGPDKVVRKTPNGEEITLSKNPTTSLHKALARVSKKYVEHYNSGAVITIKDGAGKRVGDASFGDKGNGELYLNWLGVDKSSRGKGYATQAMKAAEDFGKQAGFKKMTLEVPGNAPDALHIYEKLGFKVTSKADDYDPNDMWGGLTNMEYNFNVKHGLSSESYDYLAHYGVMGMRWGKRGKESSSSGSSSKMSAERKESFKKGAKVAGAVSLAVGVSVTAGILAKRGSTKVSSTPFVIRNKSAPNPADFGMTAAAGAAVYKRLRASNLDEQMLRFIT